MCRDERNIRRRWTLVVSGAEREASWFIAIENAKVRGLNTVRKRVTASVTRWRVPCLMMRVPVTENNAITLDEVEDGVEIWSVVSGTGR